MTTTTKNPDITIRGGLINVPKPTASITKDRHQPNTPTNKKATKPRSDHIPAPTKPPAIAAEPEPPPEGEIPDVPTPTSQSD